LEREKFVDVEITHLLLCDIIAEHRNCPRVVSLLGVVPKKNGGFCMIVDQRWLNQKVITPKFRYEDLDTLTSAVKKGD
jgi:hypothetical protein